MKRHAVVAILLVLFGCSKEPKQVLSTTSKVGDSKQAGVDLWIVSDVSCVSTTAQAEHGGCEEIDAALKRQVLAAFAMEPLCHDIAVVQDPVTDIRNMSAGVIKAGIDARFALAVYRSTHAHAAPEWTWDMTGMGELSGRAATVKEVARDVCSAITNRGATVY